jgi:hypothetical protein
VFRRLVLVTLVAVGASVLHARTAPSAPLPTVGCDEIVGTIGSGRLGGYRVVLGGVSVPPPYLEQVVESPDGSWPYWRKAGLVIRAGLGPVEVRVPRSWREHVAIGWGNDGQIGAGIRFAPCGQGPWRAYAGGFSLRWASDCVPLVVRVGDRRATVWLGIGRRCNR